MGFVSNSSSSSFIASAKIDVIAKSMLKTIIKEFSSDWGQKATKKELKEYKKWQDNLKIALKNKDVKTGKIGIVMPSCNYDTYIIFKDDMVYISTCNNHSWNTDEWNVSHNGDGEDMGTEDVPCKIIKDKDFFNVRNKLIHSRENYFDMNDVSMNSCPNPKCDKTSGIYSYVVVDGKMVCASCYQGVLNTKEMIKLPK